MGKSGFARFLFAIAIPAGSLRIFVDVMGPIGCGTTKQTFSLVRGSSKF